MQEVDVICFWCGEAKGVAEVEDDFGNGPKFADYIPCDCCVTEMIKGITLVAVDKKHQFEGQEPFGSNHYPTGSWAVIDESWIKEAIEDGEFKDHVLKRRIMLIDEEKLEELMGDGKVVDVSGNDTVH